MADPEARWRSHQWVTSGMKKNMRSRWYQQRQRMWESAWSEQQLELTADHDLAQDGVPKGDGHGGVVSKLSTASATELTRLMPPSLSSSPSARSMSRTEARASTTCSLIPPPMALSSLAKPSNASVA